MSLMLSNLFVIIFRLFPEHSTRYERVDCIFNNICTQLIYTILTNLKWPLMKAFSAH